MAAEDISFDPDEAIEGGGGLIQAVANATLTFECVTYDYNGTVAVPVPSIHVHGEYEDEEGEDAEFDEYYSAGDASKLRPKKDGTGFQALTEGAKMTKTCKAMQLINSFVSANGGDKEIGGSNTWRSNIKELDGINVDMERKPDIERPGLNEPKGGRKRTILLVTEINSPPGEGGSKKKKKGKGAAPSKASKASKGGGGGKKVIREKTIKAVCAAIVAAGGEAEAEDISQLVFRRNKKDEDVKAMTELAAEEDFLTAEDTPWGLEDGTLTYEEE